MNFSVDFDGRVQEIVALFTDTFTNAEGADEGAVIGDLARRQMVDTPKADLHVVTASEDEALVGAAVFSRLVYDRDERSVFVLGPVAVSTALQRQGIGGALIRHGLEVLRTAGVHIVIVYGDPDYYGRVGFAPITETFAAAPFPLRYPHGWMGQSLTDDRMIPLSGAATCIAAFNDPQYW